MKKSLQERYRVWGINHIVGKKIVEYTIMFLVCTASSFIFAFGFRAFLSPAGPAAAKAASDQVAPFALVSGGVSGISQNISILIEIICRAFGDAGMKFYESFELNFYPILYFVLNIPIFFLAWKGIGKRFTVFTFINVLEVSLITRLLPDMEWIYNIYLFVTNNGGLLARALFAGVCTGVASSIAFKFDFSDGGVDVISYYIALKKSTSVGKYSVILNSVTAILFVLLNGALYYWGPETIDVMAGIMYTVLYMFITAMVMDIINVRNKKVEIKIVTNLPEMSKILLLNVPHGATVSKGVGAFSGQEKSIITMVISSHEVARVVKLVMYEDPHAFVQVTALQQVYGRFFIRPVK